MNATILTSTRLVCPNDCGAAAPMPSIDVVPLGGGMVTLHACPVFAGMLVGLVPEGVRAEARAVEREDYIGREAVQYDGNGRPVMAIETVRDDGTDRVVFAPTAYADEEQVAELRRRAAEGRDHE